jgi:hypothetical protein
MYINKIFILFLTYFLFKFFIYFFFSFFLKFLFNFWHKNWINFTFKDFCRWDLSARSRHHQEYALLNKIPHWLKIFLKKLNIIF